MSKDGSSDRTQILFLDECEVKKSHLGQKVQKFSPRRTFLRKKKKGAFTGEIVRLCLQPLDGIVTIVGHGA